jgi:hypothetical protein
MTIHSFNHDVVDKSRHWLVQCARLELMLCLARLLCFRHMCCKQYRIYILLVCWWAVGEHVEGISDLRQCRITTWLLEVNPLVKRGTCALGYMFRRHLAIIPSQNILSRKCTSKCFLCNRLPDLPNASSMSTKP